MKIENLERANELGLRLEEIEKSIDRLTKSRENDEYVYNRLYIDILDCADNSISLSRVFDIEWVRQHALTALSKEKSEIEKQIEEL